MLFLFVIPVVVAAILVTATVGGFIWMSGRHKKDIAQYENTVAVTAAYMGNGEAKITAFDWVTISYRKQGEKEWRQVLLKAEGDRYSGYLEGLDSPALYEIQAGESILYLDTR